MKYILLTQGKVAFVDDEDYERLSAFKWQAYNWGVNQDCWKAFRTEWSNGRTSKHVYMHHEVLMHHRFTDHKDGDGLNNQKENLRECTNSSNGANMRKPVYLKKTSSRFKGVSWEPRGARWAAYIRVNWKKQFLGRFSSEDDAARAYDAAAKAHFGEFARPNFPENSSCTLTG